ncbi:MAG: coproporphyrinogen dehydrogenase HemZ [Candidatus Heteroscillospira sp.]
MKLYLIGHNCKYAVEQMLLTMYPEELPEYPEGAPMGDRAVISFARGKKLATAKCVLTMDGKTYRGSAAVPDEELRSDALAQQRLTQFMVKQAFYRAALRNIGKKPAWGSITGIRPAKLMEKSLLEGASPRLAMSEFCKRYDADRSKAQLSYFSAEAALRARDTLQPKDICLYVGIPFCPTRCAYCSFVSSSVEKTMHLVEPFLEALFREIEAAAAVVKELGLRVISIYVGGGTPTTLSAEQLTRLMDALRGSFDLSMTREICVEAGRPDTITPEKMAALSAAGVDRVSINPQTMNDQVLRNIGRSHTAADILSAYETVRASGDFQVNMDLIAGLPGDSAESFSHTLDEIFRLKPENITVHTLAHKKGSAITLAGHEHMSADTVGEMMMETHNRMINMGYAPYYLYRQKFTPGGYENVGWTRKGYDNLYNICIMEELCSIIALGGGASTKLVSPTGRIERIFCPKFPQEYIAGIEKVCADKIKIKEFYDAISAE